VLINYDSETEYKDIYMEMHYHGWC